MCIGARRGHTGAISSAIEKLATTDLQRLLPPYQSNLSGSHVSALLSEVKLFLTILEGLKDHNLYFKCNPDAAGRLSFTSYKKII
jgi:hypothetical protein